MESNVKALLGERISNRLSGTLAAGFDINIANALVSDTGKRCEPIAEYIAERPWYFGGTLGYFDPYVMYDKEKEVRNV